jgi:hypothetical protein
MWLRAMAIAGAIVLSAGAAFAQGKATICIGGDEVTCKRYFGRPFEAYLPSADELDGFAKKLCGPTIENQQYQIVEPKRGGDGEREKGAPYFVQLRCP